MFLMISMGFRCEKNVGDMLPEFFMLDVSFPPMYSVGGEVTGLLGSNFVLGNVK